MYPRHLTNMTGKLFVNLCLLFIGLFGTTSALTTCYACEGTSTICDDPVDISKLGQCIFQDLNTSLALPVFSKFNISPTALKLSPLQAKTGGTCGKIVLTSGSLKSTVRQCFYANIDGLDLCEYLKQNVSGVSMTCNTCNTDLCNSSNALEGAYLGLFLALLVSLVYFK